MIKATILATACLLFSAASFAATPASCTDGSGKRLPPERCMSKGATSLHANVPGFAGRKALILKNMRHAERVIKTTIACAERSGSDAALQACAK